MSLPQTRIVSRCTRCGGSGISPSAVPGFSGDFSPAHTNNAEQPNHALAPVWPLITALSAAIVLVAFINVLWLRLDWKAAEEADWVDHTHQVIALLEETLVRADDMVTGQRGFALTHEQDFLQPYLAATNRIPDLIRSLGELVGRNPDQVERLDRLRLLLAKHTEINQEHIASLIRSDPLAPDMAFRRAVKESLDAIHVVVGMMVGEENRLLAQRRKNCSAPPATWPGRTWPAGW